MADIEIRSPDARGVEVAWFGALCGDDCEFFARLVLPRIRQTRLAHEQGRIVDAPSTPLTDAPLW